MKKIIKLVVFVSIITFTIFSQSEVLRLNYNGGNQDITLAPGSKVEVVSIDGRVEVTTNLTAVQIGDLLGVTGTINNPSVNIAVANSVLTSGSGTTTLSWTIADATTCTKTGEWGTGSLAATNGNQSIGPFTGPATKTFGITCQNSLGATASDTVIVTITDPNGVNCAIDQPPILSGAEDTTIIANNTANGGLYDGTFMDFQQNASPDWPGNFGESIGLSLTRNMYISASFNTGTRTDNAVFQLAGSGNLQGPPADAVSIAISECPGDFNVHLGQSNCVIHAGFFRWSTDPSANTAVYCKLDHNKTYYLNIVHSDNSENNNYATSDCSSTYCGILGNMGSLD